MELTFEEKIKKIENIVKSLENDDMSMAEMLENFEQGSLLVKDCRDYIDKAELKFINISEKINDNSNE